MSLSRWTLDVTRDAVSKNKVESNWKHLTLTSGFHVTIHTHTHMYTCTHQIQILKNSQCTKIKFRKPYIPSTTGQSSSLGSWSRERAKTACILTFGILSFNLISMASLILSNKSSSIWAFSGILPRSLLMSWHTLNLTALLFASWDYTKTKKLFLVTFRS